MTHRLAPDGFTGMLPRRLSDDFLWGGACLEIPFKGEFVHGHFGVFVVKTAAGAYLVDTGHPVMAPVLEKQLDDFLGDEPISYIFPTHQEIPHAGLLGHWLDRYPDALVIGDTRDFHLYYPEEMAAGRFRHFAAGEALDLGDRILTFVPAVWRDLPSTLWMHDSAIRTLFVADAFAFLHAHGAGTCDRLASEQDGPDLELAQFLNNAAMFWTRFGDVPATFPDVDELLRRLSPELIAPAHGAVCDTVADLLPFFKASLSR